MPASGATISGVENNSALQGNDYETNRWVANPAVQDAIGKNTTNCAYFRQRRMLPVQISSSATGRRDFYRGEPYCCLTGNEIMPRLPAARCRTSINSPFQDLRQEPAGEALYCSR